MRMQSRGRVSGRWCPFGLLILATLLGGCADPAATQEPAPKSEESQPVADQELWDVYYIQGTRVGYGSTQIERITRDGAERLRIRGSNEMRVKRFGQESVQEVSFESIETLDGHLIEFTSQLSQGPTPLTVVGRVRGDRLELTTTSAGKSLASSIAWGNDYGGPFAPELSLLRKPMQPGQRRRLRHLVVGFNEVATTDLVAKDFGPVEMLDGTFDLLRIDTLTRFGQGQLDGVTWVDRTGQAQKTSTAALNITSYRATKEIALNQAEMGQFDLGTDLTVPVSRPIPNAHGTRQARYRIHLEGGDPASVFVSGATQRVEPVDVNTIQLTVYALRPGGDVGNPDAVETPPTAGDREPNNLVQSDDPAIVTLAKEGAGDETDPWKTALALEKFVHRTIQLKNFSQAFATAAEVAQSREGDCTEHAVLLAALCRARGIPARAAIGLVYMEGDQSFGYHMWNEVYVDGHWIPIDATLARGGIGAAHLKLAHSNLEGAGAYSSFLPVVQVTGRLKIEVEESR